MREAEGPDLSCEACGGRFVDHGDLAARIDEARPSARPAAIPRHAHAPSCEPTVHYARCPTCSQTMTRMNFGSHSGIILDVCRQHGTWFDGGELDAALDYVREGGLEDQVAPGGPPARNDEAEALLSIAQAELRAETFRQQQAVRQVTDLLIFLFESRAIRPRP